MASPVSMLALRLDGLHRLAVGRVLAELERGAGIGAEQQCGRAEQSGHDLAEGMEEGVHDTSPKLEGYCEATRRFTDVAGVDDALGLLLHDVNALHERLVVAHKRDRLVRRPQHQRQECQVLADVVQIADDAVHDPMAVLDGRGHILLAVGLGGIEIAVELVEAQPRARHHHAQRLAGGGVASAEEGQCAGAVAADSAREHEGGDLGVVEEASELQALGDEAAGRVEDHRHPAVGRQLGHLGLQREKLAADELAAEQKRRRVRAADLDAHELGGVRRRRDAGERDCRDRCQALAARRLS